MQIVDIPVPATTAARGALEVVTRFSAAALVNHCVRSYLLAASRAALDGIEVDHELLYVASLLHDLGLEPAFDSHTRPFEEAGGQVAWVFAAGAGWSTVRRDACARIIVAHLRGADVADDPEGHLLDVATGLDISGQGAHHWPADLVAAIVAAFPRLDLGPRFTACFLDQAERKPGSAAGLAVASGLAQRLAANPLDRL